jgi:hypothetical protein
MKSSMYEEHWGEDIDPILTKLSEYTESEFNLEDTSASIDWHGESDDDALDADEDVLFVAALEEDLGLELSDDEADRFFAGEMKIAELLQIGLSKEAKLSSPQEKARARIYRLQHAVALKRKAKKRRRLIKQGIKRAQKRIGSAAGGYSFIPSAGSSVGHVVAMTGGAGTSSVGSMNFSPHSSPSMSVMNTQSLNKMAAGPMPADITQAAAFNPANPIAGMAGFPKAPQPVTAIAPQIKTPKPKRPVNFKKVLPKPLNQQNVNS